MTDEEKAAAAYLKLQDDVKQLILNTVMEELMDAQSEFFGRVRFMIEKQIRDDIAMHMQNQIPNYRIVQRGTTAPW